MALLPPCAYTLTQAFGLPALIVLSREPAMYASSDRKRASFSPVSGFSYYAHFHGALDLGAPAGTPIFASEAGTVTFSGWDASGGGNKIQVQIKPGVSYCSNHCATLLAKVGDPVTRGQQIATVGATGNAVGAHDHFWLGIVESGVLIFYDPAAFLPGGALANDPRIVPEDELDPSFSPKPNTTVTVNVGVRHRLAPVIDPANIAIAADAGGPLGFPLLGTVVGEAVNGNTIWYAYWRTEIKKVYYLHTSVCGPETPWEAVGHSDADLASAVTAAVAPLNVEILTLQTDLAADAAKIAAAKTALS